MERLFAVPKDQDIHRLYSLIRQDPDFLQAFDRKQFADTPLHFAAGEGRTELALEIQRLMPSFGTKLNPDGFIPLDLAMRGSHFKTVTAMIRLNPELVGVQGREGYTPLHYAAEMDYVDMLAEKDCLNLLAEFLLICPKSIEALTVRRESAVHVAVKNGKLKAFKVLLGWLKRTDRMEVLRWADLDGNNVLHLAASCNQPQVVKLVVNHVMVNAKNLAGLTALDILKQPGGEWNRQALQILQARVVTTGESFSLADYLSSPFNIEDKILKFGAFLDKGLPGKMRNVILVVAVLLATAMYQGALNPPGGFSDEPPVIFNFNNTTPSNTSLTTNITGDLFKLYNELKTQPGGDHPEGKVLMKKHQFAYFTFLNTLTFAASVSMIILVLPSRFYNYLLFLSLSFFMANYAVIIITRHSGTRIYYGFLMFVPYTILCMIVFYKFVLISFHMSASRFSAGNNYSRNFFEIKKHLFESKYYLRKKSQGKR